MRHPSILDVVRAVTAVAPRYPQVITWWYRPASRFRLQGESGTAAEPTPRIEVLVTLSNASQIDEETVASELSRLLAGAAVRVAERRGAGLEGRLVRVLSAPQRSA